MAGDHRVDGIGLMTRPFFPAGQLFRGHVRLLALQDRLFDPSDKGPDLIGAAQQLPARSKVGEPLVGQLSEPLLPTFLLPSLMFFFTLAYFDQSLAEGSLCSDNQIGSNLRQLLLERSLWSI